MKIPRRWFLVLAGSLLFAMNATFADDEENETKIKFTEAPAAVQKTLQQESGGAKIDEVSKGKEGKGKERNKEKEDDEDHDDARPGC